MKLISIPMSAIPKPIRKMRRIVDMEFPTFLERALASKV